jgi:cytochrome c peroxidase
MLSPPVRPRLSGARGAITLATITAALASFERTLVSLDSPYDRFMRGDAGAISPQAKAAGPVRGERLQCAACHKGVLFTDATERNALHQIARGIFLDPRPIPMARNIRSTRRGSSARPRCAMSRSAGRGCMTDRP